MKKSAVILISMLFSIAIPTLAESSANYSQPHTQSDTHVSHGNGASASRDYPGLQGNSSLQGNGVIKVSNKAKFATLSDDAIRQ